LNEKLPDFIVRLSAADCSCNYALLCVYWNTVMHKKNKSADCTVQHL